jgi:hypothetical protein
VGYQLLAIGYWLLAKASLAERFSKSWEFLSKNSSQ